MKVFKLNLCWFTAAAEKGEVRMLQIAFEEKSLDQRTQSHN